jgi:hypothetical protein
MDADAKPLATDSAADEFDHVEEEGGDELDETDAAPQVSSYIAIIRIIAVLGMGLSVSFGLFIMLVGLKGVIIGIPIILLAIPCYYGMQVAERLAAREDRQSPSHPASQR